MQGIKSEIREGQQFNGGTILYELPRESNPRAFWCVCKCGTEGVVQLASLSSGKSKQCKKCGYKQGGLAQILPGGACAWNRLYSSYVSNARKRSISFELLHEDFIRICSGPCSYCGLEPSNIRKSNSLGLDVVYNGIDRVDNAFGYVLGNVATSCTRCNHAKHDMTSEQWQQWTERFVRFNKEKYV